MAITISDRRDIDRNDIIDLYKSNKWSSADKPAELYNALVNSHSLFSAWEEDKLIGIGNAISDGYLVVYFPHMLVHPAFQGRGIGRKMMAAMLKRYAGFHQQMLTADGKAIQFYESLGFERAGKTEPMWIYAGTEH